MHSLWVRVHCAVCELSERGGGAAVRGRARGGGAVANCWKVLLFGVQRDKAITVSLITVCS